MEPHRATSSGGSGAVKQCGSDSSELMLNMFQSGSKNFAAALFFLNPSILNNRFGAGAASLYGSGCGERMWLRLH
jgi:hypothetical protein